MSDESLRISAGRAGRRVAWLAEGFQQALSQALSQVRLEA
jgi:hypothetical protein